MKKFLLIVFIILGAFLLAGSVLAADDGQLRLGADCKPSEQNGTDKAKVCGKQLTCKPGANNTGSDAPQYCLPDSAPAGKCCADVQCPTGKTCSASCTLSGTTWTGGGDCVSGSGKFTQPIQSADWKSTNISECVVLKANVTIKEGIETKYYYKNQVLGPKKLVKSECKYGEITSVCQGKGADSQHCYTPDFGIIVLLNYLNTITKWLYFILMLISTIFIIYGGFLVVTAAGDPEKAGKGKKVVAFAAIGFGVALLARVIPSLVRFVIGV